MYIAAGLLLLTSWFLPLHLLPWTGWHKEALAFAAAAIAFAHVLWQKRGSRTIELPRLAGGLLILGLVVVVQGFLGTVTYQGDAVLIACYLLMTTAVVVVGAAQNLPAKSAAWLGGLLVLAGVASSVLALVQVLDVWPWADWILRTENLRRPGANLGQPNHLGTLLLFALASMGYLHQDKHISGSLAAILSALLLVGLTLTESRTGILGLVLLTAWWLWRGGVSARQRMVASVFWTCFIILVWFWPALQQTIQWAGDGTVHIATGGGGRAIVWPQLWQAIMLRPWWGWGLRNVSEAHNAVLSNYSAGEPFTYAHNIVLDLAVGIGLPLTTICLGLGCVWLWMRLRKANEPLTWYALAVFMVLGLHSLLEYPFAYAYLLFPAAFMVGILEARFAPGKVLSVSRRAVLAVFLGLSVVLGWSVWEYVQIEEDLRVARFEALKIGQTPSDYKRPQIFVLRQLDTMLKASRIVPRPGMGTEELELARQAAMRFPWTALQNRYALSLALNDRTDEAIRQLKVMRAMHGEKMYQGIRANWEHLAQEKYPELRQLPLP